MAYSQGVLIPPDRAVLRNFLGVWMTLYMGRRGFIVALGGAVLWRFIAHAQEPRGSVVGFLGSETAELFSARLDAFREGLRESGYVEGRNVVIQYRWAEGHNDRLPILAGDLVDRGVNVIAAGGTPAALSPLRMPPA